MVENTFTVTLDRRSGYEFLADVGEPGVAPLVLDESPPLGEGHGPSPSRLLAAAVGNCLSASALFCLQRAHIAVQDIHTEVEVTLTRNEGGRLRVGRMAVRIAPEVAEDDVPRMKRCLEVFQDYCLVTESVRRGINVDVEVQTRAVATAV